MIHFSSQDHLLAASTRNTSSLLSLHVEKIQSSQNFQALQWLYSPHLYVLLTVVTFSCFNSLIVLQVHEAILYWSSGVERVVNFNANALEDIYERHIEVLKDTRAKHPSQYHRMMHTLYLEAR